MQSNRYIPNNVKELMEIGYKDACLPIDQCNYDPDFLGDLDNYYFPKSANNNDFHDASHLVDEMLKKIKDTGEKLPLKILDLGCGRGGFVKALNEKYKGKVIATGITACSNEDPNIKQGNFEFLFDVPNIKPDSYHMVISRNSISYASNPAVVILNAYEAVKKDGFLLIDCVTFQNFTLDDYRKILYKIDFYSPPFFLNFHNRPAIINFFVQKSAGKKFELPLDYSDPNVDDLFDVNQVTYKYNDQSRGNINSVALGNGKMLQHILFFSAMSKDKKIFPKMTREDKNQIDEVEKELDEVMKKSFV